ncbi:MAG TPA: putative sugar O-methyltransferase [Nitrospirota bacterium]|nr:putative sugar O-methyltransferase [Nitrospirota bacterium]
MFDCLSHSNAIYLPSRFWEALNEKNIQQLESSGLQNFKQTVAQNYFTWVVGRRDKQFRYLVRHTSLWAWPAVLKDYFTYDPSVPLNRKQQRELIIFTRMLWKFAEKNDTEHLLAHIDEPLEGNPFRIHLNGKLISQDLANSILEYYSIRENFKSPTHDKVTICELGAGYGRNAYVYLKAFPHCKYIIIDIPPALYIAQHYLTSVFRDKKIFVFRPFDRLSDVESEFNAADIVFLLPHQAEMLPAKIVDLFINISSLHEMKIDQIHAYFKLIDRPKVTSIRNSGG